MSKHECEACLNDFKPNNHGWLIIKECSNFTKARMDMRNIKGLSTVIINNVQLNYADLKFPDEFISLRFQQMQTETFVNLKLPEHLILLTCWIDNITDFPDKLIQQLLINNGYYDEQHLQKYSQDEKDNKLMVNWTSDYKKRCLNLNWLFEEIYGWDWNLNIVIDLYCGFVTYKRLY